MICKVLDAAFRKTGTGFNTSGIQYRDIKMTKKTDATIMYSFLILICSFTNVNFDSTLFIYCKICDKFLYRALTMQMQTAHSYDCASIITSLKKLMKHKMAYKMLRSVISNFSSISLILSYFIQEMMIRIMKQQIQVNTM